jgi:hypothetical protein
MVPRDASYEGGCVGAWVCRDGCREDAVMQRECVCVPGNDDVITAACLRLQDGV